MTAQQALTDTIAPPSVRIRIPCAALQSYVTFFYFVDVANAPLDDFLYPEWGNVRFGTGGEWRFLGPGYPDTPIVGAAVFGPTDRAARIVSRHGSTVGFGLTPLGWERLIGLPADALANRVAPLDDRLGLPQIDIRAQLIAAADDDARTALLEALLLDRLAGTPPNSAAAIMVDRVLRGRPPDVAQFAAAAGMTRKMLALVCGRVFGFGAKRLLRRQRFLDTLGTMRVVERPRLTLLIDPEYFDQAHFNREFRALMGLSPRAYLSAPRPLMGQAALAQVAAGVTLSFKLPEQPGD